MIDEGGKGMKYLFWPPVAALAVVLMLCTGLLRIVFHLVWDFRFMGWREAYTFDGDYLFKDHTWKDVLMEIINPYYVSEDKNEDEEEDEEEDEDVRPRPKFKEGQFVVFVDVETAERVSKLRGFYFDWLKPCCGLIFKVCEIKYVSGQNVFFYQIERNGSYQCVSEDLLVEFASDNELNNE